MPVLSISVQYLRLSRSISKSLKFRRATASCCRFKEQELLSQVCWWWSRSDEAQDERHPCMPTAARTSLKKLRYLPCCWRSVPVQRLEYREAREIVQGSTSHRFAWPKIVTLLDESNPSRTECSGHLRNAIKLARIAHRRRARVGFITDDLRQSRTKVFQIGSAMLRKRICSRTLT